MDQIFILLANIILLAHAVIPHHHHEQQVCIVGEHCHGHAHETSHAPSAQGHHHDSQNESAGCLLKQFIILPSDHSKSTTGKLPALRSIQSFQAVSYQPQVDLHPPETPLLRTSGAAQPLFRQIAGFSSGLRAPPTA